MIDHSQKPSHSKLHPLSAFIFMSRWLQLPLYLGLILAQCVYVFHFWVELSDLIGAVFGNDAALQHVLTAVAVPGSALPTKLNEATIMAGGTGLDRRGHDLEPVDHGHHRRL